MSDTAKAERSPTFLKFDTPPAYKWLLRLTPYFAVSHPERPNRWVRFWQRVLLGWKWEPFV